MLDIGSDDVARLDDVALRELIALLCEAELRAVGLPVTAVTWGGEQRAADGGVDVRVELPTAVARLGAFPRSIVGIQVKATDMPRADIRGEMRPGGVIRPSVLELIAARGAYVIASSRGSCSDTALKARRKAMREALEGVRDADKLHTDFFDRNRIATWVRSHPGMVAWLRTKVGRPLQGWQSYASWANPDEEVEAPYIVTDAARVFDDRQPNGEPMEVARGIDVMREALRPARSTVRLVGLSGTGKTRMVQALFDDRIGNLSLNPRHVLYTNLNDEPNPGPVALASQLVTEGRSAILVVDNCPPDLHGRLAHICSQAHCKISILTVEYDVKDDLPERTSVFRVEPSSDDMIVTLVRARYRTMSGRSAERIAELSGGNARVALALAEHVGVSEDVSSLRSKELFDRLFRQRNPHDPNLLQAAKAFALVYSFQGTDLAGNAAELPLFAQLAGMSAPEALRSATELRRRNLVQARGPWRAVLPHALANRLAAEALQEQSIEVLGVTFVEASERLLRSFSRRLGFLHESSEARALAEAWLSPASLIGDVAQLNELGLTVLRNIAPLTPLSALDAIERSLGLLNAEELTTKPRSWRERLASLLRSLAYDAALFDRAIDLIVRLAEANEEPDGSKPITQLCESLFQVVLSGTHASIQQRSQCIRAFLSADSPFRHKLGVRALRAMMTTTGLSSGYAFEFGMRPRDYGYTPRTVDEGLAWFTEALAIVMTFAETADPLGSEIKTLLAQSMRSLWHITYMRDPLLDLVVTIANDAHWPRGWMGLRLIQRYLEGNETPDISARLAVAIEALRPKNLPELIRTIVLSPGGAYPSLDDGDEDGDDAAPMASHERRAKQAQSLGFSLASDGPTLRVLLPELVQGAHGRQFECGMGLAEGALDRGAIWHDLLEAFCNAAPDQRHAGMLAGFLRYLKSVDADFVEAQLDAIMAVPELMDASPYIHCALGLDDRGMARLVKLIEARPESARFFDVLQYGGATAPVAAASLAALLDRIAVAPNGMRIALGILHMRCFHNRSNKRPFEPDLIAFAQTLILQWRPHNDDQQLDYRLADLIVACAKARVPSGFGREICANIVEACAKNHFYSFYFPRVVASLYKFYPMEVLEVFYGDDNIKRFTLGFHRDSENRDNPAGKLPAWAIHEWCSKSPATRYPLVAGIMPLFGKQEEGPVLGRHPIADEILDSAPDKLAVVDAIVEALPPTSWSGSRAEIIAARANVLREWQRHSDPNVASYVTKKLLAIDEEVAKLRAWELERDREQDERFE
ncbi:hypothetical protein [Bosea vaviloviae]|uniref:Uncharacterized protein n=1 Tax=Bosea vaviloviae TaxID=1526658 RepID=A0A0N0MCU7_9HYPH|nr:hypothetical protein [Bosea vaviloviae]KPH81623.1 hypothetical protein AE618_07740 [Bosea vaviloviae]